MEGLKKTGPIFTGHAHTGGGGGLAVKQYTLYCSARYTPTLENYTITTPHPVNSKSTKLCSSVGLFLTAEQCQHQTATAGISLPIKRNTSWAQNNNKKSLTSNTKRTTTDQVTIKMVVFCHIMNF